MNRSTPGLPVHHKLPEFTQTHAHRVGDAIQPSHPLSSPSPSASNPSKHQGLFQWVNSLHQVVKVLEFQLQHQSFQWTPRTYLLQDELIGSPCSPRDSQESSPTPQFNSINFSALSFLHSPTLTSIHDHWKNHSLEQTDLWVLFFFNLQLNSWNNNCWSCLYFQCLYSLHRELCRWLGGQESACNAGNAGDMGFSPFIGKIPWRRKWHLPQYSCLENPMDRGAWRATVHEFTVRCDWACTHFPLKYGFY